MLSLKIFNVIISSDVANIFVLPSFSIALQKDQMCSDNLIE